MRHCFAPCFQFGLALACGEVQSKQPQDQMPPESAFSPMASEDRARLQKLLARAEQQSGERWGATTARIARRMVTIWVDELLMSAPWPGQNAWLQDPLQSEWREGRTGGLWFFRQLEQLNPGQHDDRQLAALALRCLSLGLTGCYGRSPDTIAAVRHSIQAKFNFIQESPVFPPPLPVIVKKKCFALTVTACRLPLIMALGLVCIWLLGTVHLNYRLAQLHRQMSASTVALNEQLEAPAHLNSMVLRPLVIHSLDGKDR